MNHAIQLPEELYSEIASYAAQRHEPPETVVTALLIQAIGQAKNAIPEKTGEYDPAKDPLMRLAGSIASGAPSWGDRHNDYLAGAIEDTHEQ
ncbi:MAG TPA: hypothetical protein VKQ36_06825 [Ktedonobacterales bacterium]|nr:hypothetical protein [Ktedonobacterales bacterium]